MFDWVWPAFLLAVVAGTDLVRAPWLSLTFDTGGEFPKQVDSEAASLMTMPMSASSRPSDDLSDVRDISLSRPRCAQTLRHRYHFW